MDAVKRLGSITLMEPTMTIEEFFEDNSHALFHIPFLAAQIAIGEKDGGIASLFESDGTGYGSGYANAGGVEAILAIIDFVPRQQVLDRIHVLNRTDLDIAPRFEEATLMTEDSIDPIADEVTDLWHTLLVRTFPEVQLARIEDALDGTKTAVKQYLEFQYLYSDERDANFNPAAPR